MNNLSKALNIPVMPWTDWKSFVDKHGQEYSPIPLSLAPNKNTKNLRKNDSISSLLEINIFLFGLIKMLTQLP